MQDIIGIHFRIPTYSSNATIELKCVKCVKIN